MNKEKRFRSYIGLFMGIGTCAGFVVGMICEMLLMEGSTSLGKSLGLCIGLCVGLVAGMAMEKHEAVNIMKEENLQTQNA